jgi:hypothetical protein
VESKGDLLKASVSKEGSRVPGLVREMSVRSCSRVRQPWSAIASECGRKEVDDEERRRETTEERERDESEGREERRGEKRVW